MTLNFGSFFQSEQISNFFDEKDKKFIKNAKSPDYFDVYIAISNFVLNSSTSVLSNST